MEGGNRGSEGWGRKVMKERKEGRQKNEGRREGREEFSNEKVKRDPGIEQAENQQGIP